MSKQARYFKRQYAQSLDTEFYTRADTVEQLVSFLDDSKRYIEPFDREGVSNFYKILKSSGFDIEHLQHDFDENEKYGGRVVVTNAPYISRGGIYSKLSRMCDEMYLLMTKFGYRSYTEYRAKDKCRRWSDDWNAEVLFEVNSFDCPTRQMFLPFEGTTDGYDIKHVDCVMSHWTKKDFAKPKNKEE